MWWRFIVSRILKFSLTLLLISFLIAVMVRMIPGDPASRMLGRAATPEQVALLRHRMGLDQPILIQYLKWLQGVLQGRMGESYRLGIPVNELVLERYPRTLSCVFLGTIISLIVSLTAGIISARKANTWFDFTVTSISLLGVSMPSFLTGIILIYIFSVKLGWLPTSGWVHPTENFWEYIKHLLMPATTLGLAVGAIMTRMVRATLLEVLYENYIIVARAKGLEERLVLLRHALRNTLIPVVTAFGIQMGYMLGGSVVIEDVFTFPGVGQLVVTSIMGRDYILVQAGVLAYAMTFMAINFVTDISYGFLDPRVRVG
ncbi:MAG: ABC transporter permease [Anaerolineae bacterium]